MAAAFQTDDSTRKNDAIEVYKKVVNDHLQKIAKKNAAEAAKIKEAPPPPQKKK